MSTLFGNCTPNKILNYKINSLTATPKFSQLLPLKENNNLQLKLFNSMKNCLFSNNKTNFNSNSNNKNNSCFLIPFSKSFIPKIKVNQNTNDFTHSKLAFSSKKILLTETKTIKHNINKNFSFTETKSKPQELINTFLNKKRKKMTSEEIELEKIKEEKDINKKLMGKNKKLYLKSFNYSPMKIMPSPLTTFIPFKLSSNNNSKYLKQGKTNTLYEINKQNQKIRLKMQQKIEKLTDNITKDRILLNNVDYLKKQNELYNDLFNDVNFINNSFIKENDENKALNIKERSTTPTKNFNQNKNNKGQIFNSQIKKVNKNNNILSYLKSLRK